MEHEFDFLTRFSATEGQHCDTLMRSPFQSSTELPDERGQKSIVGFYRSSLFGTKPL
jgi:hypothetical protein